MRTRHKIWAGLGGLLLAVGGTAAAAVGPDSTWAGDVEPVPGEGAVIATASGLLNVAGVTLRVSAAGEGQVFVGAAHPVHVTSYLEEVSRTEITSMSSDGVGEAEQRSGAREYPTKAPEKVDIWEISAQGQGERARGHPAHR